MKFLPALGLGLLGAGRQAGPASSPLSPDASPADLRRAHRAIDQVMAVAEWSPEGRLLSANERFCDLLGLRADELTGRLHEELGGKGADADAFGQIKARTRAGERVVS